MRSKALFIDWVLQKPTMKVRFLRPQMGKQSAPEVFTGICQHPEVKDSALCLFTEKI